MIQTVKQGATLVVRMSGTPALRKHWKTMENLGKPWEQLGKNMGNLWKTMGTIMRKIVIPDHVIYDSEVSWGYHSPNWMGKIETVPSHHSCGVNMVIQLVPS